MTLPDKLIAYPSFLAKDFAGYEHHTDQTVMSFNKFTFPSGNFTIPSFDKVEPDLGKSGLGQVGDEDSGIIGNKEKYKNLGGLEMEARVFPSTDTSLKDVIEVLFLNTRLVFTSLSGSFTIGETITGVDSGASAIITDIVGTVLFLRKGNMTDFNVGEVITNSTVTASGMVDRAPTDFFLQITENANPLPRGVHEYYFDSWFDTTLNNPTQPSTPSKGLNRMIWVNGYRDPSTKKGAVYSWTGGLATITSFVANTSVSINPATTWRSLGFTEDASGTVFIVINGVSHAVAVPADLDTSTIRITSTNGISIGDFATSQIEIDVAPIPFDVCRQNKGYMFYGDWNFPNAYQSNAFNRSAQLEITDVQAALNDLLTNPASAYTGITESIFHIVIDSVSPDVNVQSFTAPGLNGLDDGLFVTSGYSALGNIENIYKVLIVADVTLGLDHSSVSGTFLVGETVIGAGSGGSGATGLIVKIFPSFEPGIDVLAISSLLGSFNVTDTITGLSSGATSALATDGVSGQDWIQYYKNGVLQTITSATVTGTLVPISVVLTTTLTDGLTMTWGNYFGHEVGDVFELDIRQGGIDTFKWQKDGGAFTSLVPITTAYQSLSDGVQIKFLNFNGHDVGDFWDVTAIPSVTRAFDNFYYALPTRRPGEGYIYNLPSNFWTMDTQEDTMYVNSSFGEWGFISTDLSADLKSETVAYTPLKQAGANKVLYPYLTGHNNDMLVWINTEHSLDTLGRQPLIEKPQTGYLSDPVKLDFLASSFIGGRIKYFGKRLYISSPREGITHVFDIFKNYWQAPKYFPEIGLLSIVEDNLVCHSNLKNQSFTIFTNSAGDGFDNSGYTVEIRTPFTDVGNRWQNKRSSMSFIEGYITGAPTLIHTAYIWSDKTTSSPSHVVVPVSIPSLTIAPFGEGPFGSHSFGSSVPQENPHFYEIYKDYEPALDYYFISLGITCVAKSHTYKILSLGMNGIYGLTGNNSLFNQSEN